MNWNPTKFLNDWNNTLSGYQKSKLLKYVADNNFLLIKSGSVANIPKSKKI